MIYYDPKLFLQSCVKLKNDFFYSLMEHFSKNVHDCTWPAQRACIFGFASLFTVDANDIPPTLKDRAYINSIRKLLSMTTELVLAVNYNEGDETDEDENESNDNEDNDNENDKNNIINNDEDGDNINNDANGSNNTMNGNNSSNQMNNGFDSKDGEADMSEEDLNGSDGISGVNGGYLGEESNVLNLDADEDYIDGRDVRYMQQCMDMETNPMLLSEIMLQWDDNSNTIPNTPLDHLNEVVYFFECVNQLNSNNVFAQVVQDWNQKLPPKDRIMLDKYLEEGRQGIEDMKQRQAAMEKEKIQRRQAALTAAREAEALRMRMNTNNNNNNSNNSTSNGSNNVMNGNGGNQMMG